MSKKEIQYTITDIECMVQPILKKYSAEQAGLFGSYARNEATPDSDIDLMVIGGSTFDPTDVFCIADELYSTSGKNVDVYEKREIDEKSDFFKNIMSDGVVIK